MQETESKISNVEWGLVIGALFAVDLIQVALDWMLIGIALNPFIDMFVGMSFALYLQLRGEKLSDPKRGFSLIATFLLEMVPGLNELPLWCLDGFYAMTLSKRKVIMNAVSPKVGGNQEITRNEVSDDEDMPMAA